MAVKQSDYTRAVERMISVKLKAIDMYIDSLAETIGDVGNPERLVGAPYDEWKDNPQVLHQLQLIYGAQEPNPLSELIFRKNYERVLEQEAQVGVI